MRRNNKQITTTFILCSLLLIGVVYAILQANLQINGTAKIQANTWDIHFDNIQVNENSVSIGTGDSAATIDPENNCKVDFEVTLSIPGDFYEFTIDVVNAGTIDGMIGELNKTLKVNNEIVSETPDYLNYSVTYSDGDEILENHKLTAGSTETYLVRLEFKTDIEELPESTIITTSLEPQFLQADSSSVYRADADFATSSWDEIVKTYKIGNLTKLNQAMEAGTTRAVQLDLDFDGTYETTSYLRIANLSTPEECSTAGFSQSACGFVIEFSKTIMRRIMNPIKYYDTSTNGYNNKGGWEYSDIRAFLNSGIYLEGTAAEIDYTNEGFLQILPTDLQKNIINTTIVSGHGAYDSENFVTIDKMYLLAPKEIWVYDGTNNVVFNDTAREETRQLDYYQSKNVTTTNYSGASKLNPDGYGYGWWLRTAKSNSGNFFFQVASPVGTYSSNDLSWISPAFRIAE